jgi:hypothetical protein
VDDYLRGMQTFSHIKDRVDFFVEPDEGEPVADLFKTLFASVLNGSHVIICERELLANMLSKVLYSSILLNS